MIYNIIFTRQFCLSQQVRPKLSIIKSTLLKFVLDRHCWKWPQGVSGVHADIVSKASIGLAMYNTMHFGTGLWLVGPSFYLWVLVGRQAKAKGEVSRTMWRNRGGDGSMACQSFKDSGRVCAINLFPLYPAVLHECLWEYRNVTVDLWSSYLLMCHT